MNIDLEVYSLAIDIYTEFSASGITAEELAALTPAVKIYLILIFPPYL